MKLTAVTESSLSRVHSAMQKHAAGAVTAYRGCKEYDSDDCDTRKCVTPYTHAENQARNRSLMMKLRAKGYGVTAVNGSYVEGYGTDSAEEVMEHSFFVVNLRVAGDDNGELEQALVELGKAFNQDSILSIRFGQKASLVGTQTSDTCGFPALGAREEVGSFHGGKAAQFMSRINDRTFTFEDYTLPMERAGKLGLTLAASKPWEYFLTEGS